MAASAGSAAAFTIGSIFRHIIDCVQLYFTNGFTNIWLVGVTFIFDGTPQIRGFPFIFRNLATLVLQSAN